jgi:GDP-mannose 4,6-dehydratase
MKRMSCVSYLRECRICKQSNLKDVISLNDQHITSRFPKYGDFSTPKTSIVLCMCTQCGLVQLRETTHSEELYEHEYGYRSGISNTMRQHLKSYQEDICSRVSLQEGDTIVDIGSNDSTMLQYYGKQYRRIGVDPTGKQFQQFYGDVELLPTYFTYENFTRTFGDIKCKMVSSISMFYDLPDPVQFAKDIYQILDEEGLWTCEQSYLLTMLRTNSVDTICHEHLEYYALHQVKEIADRSNFKIVDVQFNDCNGGSFRVYFAKKGSLHRENTDVIRQILQEEVAYGVMKMDGQIYSDFMNKCAEQVSYLKTFIHTVNANDKKVYVYGASTKGNCLLQYAELTEVHMKYAVERNLTKVGKMTSTGIEIISEETMRENPPDYLLVLPWHFRKEITERERDFLEKGGQFIFPFPQFEIVGSKPKMLITGCDGMIAHYVKERCIDYNLYGISRSFSIHEKQVMKFYFDLTDTARLDYCVSMIRPDVIVHLASISSSHYAMKHPVEALQSNGLLAVQLCELVRQKGWSTKLFNASSSEIYKGHVDYEVQEDDPRMFNVHPYSIAKIAGHSMVDFYRQQYGLPFSNGVLFTTESPLKRKEFLLNKVAAHIKEWKRGNKHPLQVGNLDSYRNMIHAADVANAIHAIVAQPQGDTYLICNEGSHKVYDVVAQLYGLSGIEVERIDDGFVDKETGLPLLVIDAHQGRDAVPLNIRGDAKKLKKLGWTPQYSLKNILGSLL